MDSFSQDQKPKRKGGRRLWLIGLLLLLPVILCIGFLALVFGGALLLTKPVADAGSAFMTAIRDNELESAYAMFTPELMEEVSFEDFQTTFAEFGLESWDLHSRSVENNTGLLSGTATIFGEAFSVQLNFVKQDGDWRVIAYNFDPS